MRTLESWLAEYAISHQNRTNQKIHVVCVPAIVFSILGLAWSIPVPGAMEGIPFLNWATLSATSKIVNGVLHTWLPLGCKNDASDSNTRDFWGSRATASSTGPEPGLRKLPLTPKTVFDSTTDCRSTLCRWDKIFSKSSKQRRSVQGGAARQPDNVSPKVTLSYPW